MARRAAGQQSRGREPVEGLAGRLRAYHSKNVGKSASSKPPTRSMILAHALDLNTPSREQDRSPCSLNIFFLCSQAITASILSAAVKEIENALQEFRIGLGVKCRLRNTQTSSQSRVRKQPRFQQLPHLSEVGAPRNPHATITWKKLTYTAWADSKSAGFWD